MSRVVSFVVLVGFIVVIGFLFYRVMAPFLLPLFLAALLVVIFHPLHVWILEKCKGRVRTAALLTTAAIVLIVFVPVTLVLSMAAIEGSALVTRLDPATIGDKFALLRDRVPILKMPHADSLRYLESGLGRMLPGDANAPELLPGERKETVDGLLERVDELQSDQIETTDELVRQIEDLRATLQMLQTALSDNDAEVNVVGLIQRASSQFQQLKLSILGGPARAWVKDWANPSDQELQEFSRRAFDASKGWLFTVSSRTTVGLVKIIIGAVIMIVSVYFFLIDGPRMINTFMRLSPLDDRYEQELLNEFETVSRAVVVATLLSAITQGILAGFGYWLAGLDAVFLLMLLTGVLAMVPFLGAAAVWVPASLWLFFYEDRLLAAVLLAVFGAAVISTADNLIKMVVLHGRSRLHPLLALISVLGGVTALGPIGILVGPMVVVFLQTLLNILHRELTSFDTGEQPA